MRLQSLYDGDGWIDVPSIEKCGYFMNIFIGPRRNGKTFGVLKHMLTENRRFIYMRRTVEELELVTSDPECNPFLDMKQAGFSVDIVQKGKTWIFGDYETDQDGKRTITNRRGVGMPLSAVGKMRGFSGSGFTDLVFDEFIPDPLVPVRKAEGDAFLSFYDTINSNRELMGDPPLRVWLLANSNRLDSPILKSLMIIPDIERMQKKGIEYRILDNKIFVAVFRSKEITDMRRKTSLNSFLLGRGGNSYTDMALEAKFSYSDTSRVKKKSLKGFRPYLRIGSLYIWEYQSEHLYVCNSRFQACRYQYEDTPDDSIRVQIEHPEIKMMWLSDRITFSDAGVMYDFKRLFKIST